jgi:hypothetical protein
MHAMVDQHPAKNHMKTMVARMVKWRMGKYTHQGQRVER